MNAPTATNQSPPVQAVARRPQPTDFKPLAQLDIQEMLSDPRALQALTDASAQHLSPQRMLRVMAQALRKTPNLALCSPLSLLGAMISCASLGLEPNTPLGHAYLIPFAKRGKNAQGRWETIGYEINLIIGYQGLLDLCRRTGSLTSVHADVVYEGDEFSFEYGSNMHLMHRPTGVRENRKPIWAYSHANLEDGQAFEVLPYAEILNTRNATQGYIKAMEDKAKGEKNWAKAPWVAYEHEMACKTMFRRLSKWLPKSIEFATAVQMDSLAERGMIDFRAIAENPMLAHDPDAVTIDAETGEITDKKTEPKPKATTAPKPAEAKAAEPRPQPDPPKPDEAAEREADRLQREAQGEQVTIEEEDDNGWGDYLKMMQGELEAQKTAADVQSTNATFRDAVVGAVERKEITEEYGTSLLNLWNPAVELKKAAVGKPTPQPPKPKAK